MDQPVNQPSIGRRNKPHKNRPEAETLPLSGSTRRTSLRDLLKVDNTAPNYVSFPWKHIQSLVLDMDLLEEF